MYKHNNSMKLFQVLQVFIIALPYHVNCTIYNSGAWQRRLMDETTVKSYGTMATKPFINKFHCGLECEKLPGCNLWCIMSDDKCWLSDLLISGTIVLSGSSLISCYVEARGGGLQDVVVGATGYQSSVAIGRSINYVLDGVYSKTKDYNSVALTKLGAPCWMLFDLGKSADIREVVFYTPSAYKTYCDDIEVRVGPDRIYDGDFSSHDFFGYQEGACNHPKSTIFKGEKIGRFVSLKSLTDNAISISHIEIYATFQ